MNFGEALEVVKAGGAMRLPTWQPDVSIKLMKAQDSRDMTADYLYVESRYGRVPWKETMIELLSNKWEAQ